MPGDIANLTFSARADKSNLDSASVPFGFTLAGVTDYLYSFI